MKMTFLHPKMAYSICFCFIFFVVFSCTSSTETATDAPVENIPTEETKTENNTTTEKTEYIIEQGAVGKIKIGEQIPTSSESYDIKKEVKRVVTEEGESEEPFYVVSEGGEELMVIRPSYDSEKGAFTNVASEILVTSDKAKTKEGLGLNSTIEDFITAYPDYKIWYTYVSEMYVIESASINAQFLLKSEDFIGKIETNEEVTVLKKEDFKAGAKILKVRVL